MFTLSRIGFVASLALVAGAFAGPSTEMQANAINDISSKAVVTSDDVAQLARELGADSYFLLPGNSTALNVNFGVGLLALSNGAGNIFESGSSLTPGIYWNFGAESVWLGDNAGTPQIEVPINGVVVVGDDENISTLAASSGTSVECGAGFYACCNYNSGGNTTSAQCIANGTAPAPRCQSGGPGATKCSIGMSSAIAIDIASPGDDVLARDN